MDNKKDFSRREFLRDSAVGGAGLALAAGLAPARVLGANDRIRVGALGTGERAQYHDGYYAAYVLDPDGTNVELVNHHRG